MVVREKGPRGEGEGGGEGLEITTLRKKSSCVGFRLNSLVLISGT